ncbi:glycosyltransferase family 4 protein [Pseudomonas sp. NA-150]|uniref:glycosyltransferase family 4 protein n=1 Tax=Pseudomonas sp. NA-150 TaxID=3367525 RepID=UPI0037C8B5FA
MAPRVLLLTQWFDPEPTFKGLVFARELMSQGFDVEVLTGFPNYPGGKIYPGFKMRWLQKEIIDGVSVTRVPLYPSHGQSGVGRILNYISFAAAALVYGLFGARRPDVIYAYHPPLTVGIAASLLRSFRRVPVVYDIQDMWPDTLRATGMFSNEKILGLISSVCDWVYRHVDQVVVLSPGFKSLLIERGVPSDKIEVIYNWCSEDDLKKPNKSGSAKLPMNGMFRILFAGNLGKAQALDHVLKAAALVKSEHPDIAFIFLGGGVEASRLKDMAASMSLTNVDFLPPVPMSEVGSYLQEADALLVHLKKDKLFEVTIPSKTQAYMAAGRPLLMAVDGDAAALVTESQCGVIADSESAKSLAAAAIMLKTASPSMLQSMASNGKQFYEQSLSLEQGVKKFGFIFRRLAKKQ